MVGTANLDVRDYGSLGRRGRDCTGVSHRVRSSGDDTRWTHSQILPVLADDRELIEVSDGKLV